MRNANLVDRLNKTLKPRINRSPWVSWEEMTKREKASYKKFEKSHYPAYNDYKPTEQ